MRAQFEVADVVRQHWQQILDSPKINSWQLRTLGAIMRCRTADMGGHVDACTSCGTVRISYNSCRNRHCPKCQGKEREKWIEAREEELLPVPYFHVVFTLPDSINQLAMHRPKEVYDSLFDAAWNTIKIFGNDSKHLGAKTGMISILHTWGQTMQLHPHLHCIVPGGGLTQEGKWKYAKTKGKYLFPVKAMSKVFRAKYVSCLKTKSPDLDKRFINSLFAKDWVVYAKRPFHNVHSVIEYLGRYTHKIAISNHRIKNISSNSVKISYKDYRNAAVIKEMELNSMEFINRFCLHILPKGFTRIRHYGILSSTSKIICRDIIKEQLPEISNSIKPEYGIDNYNPLICPHCKTETMVQIEILPKRGPPKLFNPNLDSLLNVVT